jgi:hypothetical protein
MIRFFALLVVTATWLAGAGPLSAQDADFRDFFRSGPNFGKQRLRPDSPHHRQL